jgi:hypothetical protein
MFSGGPAQEIGQNADANLLAFLDVKLRAGAITGGDEGNHRSAIICRGNGLRRITPHQSIAVYEISMIAGM